MIYSKTCYLTINIIFPSVEPCYLKKVKTDPNSGNLLFVNLSSKAKAKKISSYLINTKSISSSANGRLVISLPLVYKELEIIGKSSHQQDFKHNLKLKDRIVFFLRSTYILIPI